MLNNADTDTIKKLNVLFKNNIPDPSVLESTYLILILKSREFKRKIINTMNAIRSVEKKIIFDLV